MSMLDVALDPGTVVVAVDPGKVMNRVWLSDGSGLLVDPASMPVSRDGIASLEAVVHARSGDGERLVIAIEATGSLHRAWASELERLHPGAVRLLAPSETKAARVQLGSGRFKTDDRDCAALTYLARQGAGRPWAEELAVDTLRGVVRHRHGLSRGPQDASAAAARPAQRARSWAVGTAGNGRALAIEQPSGQAVLACAVAFAGRAPTVRSLQARAVGRFTTPRRPLLGPLGVVNVCLTPAI